MSGIIGSSVSRVTRRRRLRRTALPAFRETQITNRVASAASHLQNRIETPGPGTCVPPAKSRSKLCFPVRTDCRNRAVPNGLFFVHRIRYGETVASFTTPTCENFLTACVGHPGPKSVLADSPLVVGLIRPFHELCLIGMKLVRGLVLRNSRANGSGSIQPLALITREDGLPCKYRTDRVLAHRTRVNRFYRKAASEILRARVAGQRIFWRYRLAFF